MRSKIIYGLQIICIYLSIWIGVIAANIISINFLMKFTSISVSSVIATIISLITLNLLSNLTKIDEISSKYLEDGDSN